MKKRICAILSLIILSQAVLLPLSATEAKADTRVTIYFAAGGVMGGIFFFLRFTFRAEMPKYGSDGAALFNHDSEGWKIDYPVARVVSEEDLKTSSGRHSPDTTYLEILKIRF